MHLASDKALIPAPSGRYYPAAVLVCPQCARMELFNTVAMGLDRSAGEREQMADSEDNVYVPPPGPGGPVDDRLRRVELQVTAMGRDLQHVGERMTTEMATKKDISDLKVWILGGVLSAIIVGAGMAAVVVKAFA